MGDDDYVRRGEFDRLDERVTTMDKRLAITELRTDHNEERLSKIESNTTWILRLVIGAIITALIGVIII